jgi:CDP-diacylglycerol pyrophosphatase
MGGDVGQLRFAVVVLDHLAGGVLAPGRIDGEDLSATNPFQLLAHDMPGAAREMGAWTLALVGETGADGQPGYYLLAERADPARGEDASSEVIQDHDCKAQLAYITTHPG